MRFFSQLVLTGISMLVLSGCQQKLGDYPVGGPEQLEGWQGVNRIARDGPYYFAGQPNESAFRRLADEAGIMVVINIRPHEELRSLPFDEPALVEELGLKYVNIPVVRMSFSTADVDRFTEVLAGERGPVLVHCRSSDRAGGLWAAYLILKRGFGIESALEAGKAAGMRSTAMIDAVMSVVEER